MKITEKGTKKFTKKEKLELIKLSLDKDQSIKELGGRFEISAGTIYNWRNKYFKYNKGIVLPKVRPIKLDI